MFKDVHQDLLDSINAEVNESLKLRRKEVRDFAMLQFTETFNFDPSSADYEQKSEEFFNRLVRSINELTIEIRKDGKIRLITTAEAKALMQYDRGTTWFTPRPDAIDRLLDSIFSG